MIRRRDAKRIGFTFDCPTGGSRMDHGKSIAKFVFFGSQKSIIPLLLLFTSLSRISLAQHHDEIPIELSGFSVSESYEIKDDEPLDLDAYPIEKLLYRLRSTSPRTRFQFSQFSRETSWEDVVDKTDQFRMWMFDRVARVKKIEMHSIGSATEDSEIKRFYVCHCELVPEVVGADPRPLIVIARTIPKLLAVGTPIDEPVRMVGFLYLRTIDPSNRKLPVFVSDRLAWFPKQSRLGGATPAHVALAAHGVDIGQFDYVKQNNAKPLRNHDSESFFQLISSVAKMRRLEDSVPRLTFNDLVKKGDKEIGNAVRINGSVRTCSVVTITDNDIQDRLGVSRYYQLMIFPNLGGKKIIIEHRDGTQTEYSQFPVTVICTELPGGMSPEDIEKKQVQIDGFFFRFWSFRSEKSDQSAGTGQPSPLLIAKQPVLLESGTEALNSILFWGAISLLAGIAALILGIRFMDRRNQRQTPSPVDQLPKKIDVSNFDEQQ